MTLVISLENFFGLSECLVPSPWDSFLAFYCVLCCSFRNRASKISSSSVDRGLYSPFPRWRMYLFVYLAPCLEALCSGCVSLWKVAACQLSTYV